MRTRCGFLLLLCVFSLQRLLAQSQKLSIAVTLTPQVSHTKYIPQYLFPDSDGQLVEPVFLNGSRWATGYTAGISIQFQYAPGWSVSSGLWMNQLNTRQERLQQAGEGTVALRSRVARLPILLNYTPGTRRLSPYFSFGTLIDMPLPSRIVVDRVGESRQSLPLKPLFYRPTFHMLVGAGAVYQLSDTYTLVAQPLFSYNLGQLGASSYYSPSFTLGLQVQAAYTIPLKPRR